MSINDLTKRILSFMNLDLKTYTFIWLVSVEITDRDIYCFFAQDTFDSSSNTRTTYRIACLDVQLPFVKLHFGVVEYYILLPEMKFHFGKNDRNEITFAVSFISGYFMLLRIDKIENLSFRP